MGTKLVFAPLFLSTTLKKYHEATKDAMKKLMSDYFSSRGLTREVAIEY
jgi:hypothetical protein